MPIDNNETEQLMKQVALGRKNWMFIGSVDAGYRAADLMTLVSSAARNDLDVFLYVKDVLDRLLAAGGSEPPMDLNDSTKRSNGEPGLPRCSPTRLRCSGSSQQSSVRSATTGKPNGPT
jgi:hypothetical protein